MLLRRLSRCLSVIAGLVLLPGLTWDRLRAVEPWADPRLAVTNGVVAWFDVSRQSAARGRFELGPLQSGNDAPDHLFDASGHGRHLRQPMLPSRPRFLQEFNGAMLSFDGTNDFLAGDGFRARLTNATLFLVAAPRQVGGFAGPLSFNAIGRNDYTSGLNLDFGSAPAPRLAAVNVEGPGFVGEANLLPPSSETAAPERALGRWHVFAVTLGHGTNGIRLHLDGIPRGTRTRQAGSVLALDELTLGARHYSNGRDRPFTQNFFAGLFAEALIFDRLLSDPELATVHAYLDAKYGALLRGLSPPAVREGTVALVPVTNPPPVQVHLPGFRADPLPVELTNLNNVRYRPDGKLIGVAYDGRIWLLSDTDGDGLEDRAEPFWDKLTLRTPIGAALTPPGYARGQGVFVAGKEKLSLIVDRDGDDRADEEIIVATWTEKSEQQGVDALGVAVSPDGSIYFCIGARSYTDGYVVDHVTGESTYPLYRERGTIQRVRPDFSGRETVCTGIRFAIGLAFNPAGDLFATEQEGATWLPNGNPFDELLHIQSGRHYGYPPRHPRLLPDVIDEPSTFDYAPQHQSTCGLWFNSPWQGRSADGRDVRGPIFGPGSFADDAFVCGYSRGKLWRTKLVKTPAGYVAQNQLLATLQALTIDATVSPRGDLVVATHSGQPDWGSGPNGKGKLWRIRYIDRETPQPVAAWNPAPTELEIAFDRPLDPAALRDLPRRARIESGTYVAAADRFETVRPGYQVVYDQLTAPRATHEILGTRLSPDRRTLRLLTRPRDAAVNYAITLPPLTTNMSGTLATPSETDLLTDLGGLAVRWHSSTSTQAWSGWLPHADLSVARHLTDPSAGHEPLFRWLLLPGVLVLQTQLDLYEMLQPAIQPGATLGYERPTENVRLHAEAALAFRLIARSQTNTAARGNDGRFTASLAVPAPGRKWQPVEFQLETGNTTPDFRLAWSTDNDPRPRPFPLRRFLLPHARPADATAAPAGPREIPEIAGGDWERGRRLFFGDQLACSRCHAIRDEGGRVGPDLSNLLHRDYASVRKDIEFPNASINPDHVASTVELTDGDTITALVQTGTNGLVTLVDASGQPLKVEASRVKSIRPSTLSLMPEGMWSGLGEENRRDLMTFLLVPGPTTPPLRR